MTTTINEMTNFTFKIDKKTREKYSALCDEFGLSMSAATLALIKQAIRSQRMTFDIKDENGFTTEEVAELKRRIAEVDKGNYIEHPLIEV